LIAEIVSELSNYSINKFLAGFFPVNYSDARTSVPLSWPHVWNALSV